MPKGIIHQMVSISEKQLITLHFYYPKIQRMRIYDLDRNAVCTVKTDCGAWIPKDIRQILFLDRINL